MTRQKITTLIHHPYRAPPGFGSPATPIHKASTIFFPSCAALNSRYEKQKTGYIYGLHGTPTSFVLEERLATLEGGLHTLLLPSGLAAITLVNMALLKTGDEVLIPANAYGPSIELARHQLSQWGITHRLYNPLNAAEVTTLMGPNTKLIWLEAAGSVTLEFPDLVALVNLAKERNVITVLDNTWGAGIAFNAFNLTPTEPAPVLGVDITIQALTKYPSGGGDVLMGSVTTRDEALHQRLNACHMRMGWGVGAGDLEAVLRALPTIELRYEAQDRSARVLAQWWTQQPQAKHVLHPALPSSPGHAHWQRISPGHAACLFSVVFDEKFSVAQVHAFVDALQLFKIGLSWAGPISLAVPFNLSALRGSNPWGGCGHLVRFAVGFEAIEDLMLDCEQALSAMALV